MGFSKISKDRFLDFADIEKAKLQSKGRAVSGESRADVPLFELVESNTSYSKTNSSYWVNCSDSIDDTEVACPADDQLIYVAIANYKIVNENGSTQDETESLESLLRDHMAFKRLFKKFNKDEDAEFPVIHGVRRKDCKKLSDGYWISWDDYKLDFAKKFLKKNKAQLIESEKIALFRETQYDLKHYQKIKEIISMVNMPEHWEKLDGGHLINQAVSLLKNVQEVDNSDFDAIYRMFMFVKKHDEKWVEENFPTTSNLDDFDNICKEINEKYPLLRNIGNEIYGWQNMNENNFGKNIIHYVEVCDIVEKCENNS